MADRLTKLRLTPDVMRENPIEPMTDTLMVFRDPPILQLAEYQEYFIIVSESLDNVYWDNKEVKCVIVPTIGTGKELSILGPIEKVDAIKIIDNLIFDGYLCWAIEADHFKEVTSNIIKDLK